MKNRQSLVIKQKIARFCVVLLICTTIFGTFLAFSGESNPEKKHAFTKLFSKENPTSGGNTYTNSFRNK